MFNTDNYKNVVGKVIPFHQVRGLQPEEIKEGYFGICISLKKELVAKHRTSRFYGGVIRTAMDAAGITSLRVPVKRTSYE